MIDPLSMHENRAGLYCFEIEINHHSDKTIKTINKFYVTNGTAVSINQDRQRKKRKHRASDSTAYNWLTDNNNVVI